MTLYSPAGLALLSAIPGIVLLYMLRQRFIRQEVSSVYLWDRVLRDMEVSTPWQKLKKNILMILQILCVALIAFALSNPYIRVTGKSAGSVVIVIDTSMSMQSTDISPSRIEAAKKEASRIVENLRPGTPVTLVDMGDDPVILENLSTDSGRVLRCIEGIHAGNYAEDAESTASLINSILKAQPDTRVVFLTDYRAGPTGPGIEHVILNGGGTNHALTHQSFLRAAQSVTVLTRVESTEAYATVPVSLYVNGEIFDSREVVLGESCRADVYWDGIPADADYVESRIDIKDSLEADNRAWSVVSAEKPGKVLLAAEKNMFLEKALSLVPGIEVYKSTPQEAEELHGYDLYVFDGVMPEKLPDASVFLINPPANDLFKAHISGEGFAARMREHRITQHIRELSFNVGLTQVLETPLWGDVLFESESGCIAFAGKYEGKGMVVLGFDIHDTDMPLQPVFPIFIADAVKWLLPGKVVDVEAVITGQAVEFNLNPSAVEVSVRNPSGEVKKLAPPFPPAPFDDTGNPGVYTLLQKTADGPEEAFFTVNVPASRESGIGPAGYGETPGIGSSGEETVKGETAGSREVKLQGLILWFILAVLVIEWWVYSNAV